MIDERGWAKNHTPARLLRATKAAGMPVEVPE